MLSEQSAGGALVGGPAEKHHKILVGRQARRAGRAATRLAVPLDHHLEVLARHHHRSIPRTIGALDQLEQIASEGRLPLAVAVQRREGLVHRTVPGAEYVDEVLRRTVAEGEMAAGRLDLPL